MIATRAAAVLFRHSNKLHPQQRFSALPVEPSYFGPMMKAEANARQSRLIAP